MEPQFIGQVVAFAFDFAPRGWKKCDGSLLNIAQYPMLYGVLGTKFGGDGIDTFGLPDLRDRTVIGSNPVIEEGEPVSGYIGFSGGATSITQDASQVGSHRHDMYVYGNDATETIPAARYALAIPMRPNPPGADVRLKSYRNGTPGDALHAETIELNRVSASSMDIRNPFQVLNYCIATEGYAPTPD